MEISAKDMQAVIKKYGPPAPLDENTFIKVVQRTRRLPGKVDMVLDTDAFNEIDDQYAIGYLLASQDKVNIKAIFAAPFALHHARTPKEGMEKSYDEIINVLELTGWSSLKDRVFRGSDAYLPDEKTPVDSPAARELVRLAMEHTEDDPLYVVCIAAPVNVASAILMEPQIVERMVVIWAGGVSLHWPVARCFNGGQSLEASRVLMSSSVPLVLTPGRGAADRLLISGPELECWLRGKNRFCDYLVDKTIAEAEIFNPGKIKTWTRQLPDVVAVAWVLGDSDKFMLERFEHRPVMDNDYCYNIDPCRPMMRYVYYVKRDNLMDDLVNKLTSFE